MCGIVGIFNLREPVLPAIDVSGVLGRLHHRGPDDRGSVAIGGVFLGATRLAIIDPAGGRQPMATEDGRFHIVMNGEVYDYGRLMDELKGRGHVFGSQCDTEVVLHLVEDLWAGALDRIDGQFALAVHDARERRLLLARDRMGVCPLFYATVGDYLVFGSEMKAIFATGLLRPAIDPRALDTILAIGTVPAPRAVFDGVRCLPPGHWLEAVRGRVVERRFWDIPYPDAGEYPDRTDRVWADMLREALGRSCRRRLRADVPVGLYLSGGIDSATVGAMVSGADDVAGRAFSIRFPEPGFDESRRTQALADDLGLQVQFLTYTQRDLAGDIPTLVYHSEIPQVATESVPLLALSGLAARHAKVVLTGEGSDEALGGYPYFLWDVFLQRAGASIPGRLLIAAARRWFRRTLGSENPCEPTPRDLAWADEVFGCYPAVMARFFYLRRLRELVYSTAMFERQRGLSDAELVDVPRQAMLRWDQVNRSLYVDSRLCMTSHLLAAHGDRALMAHSIEGRYPFLDREVQELLAAAPPRVKLRWHTGKRLLRQAMKSRLPRSVTRRVKKPFLAPFGTPFVGADTPEYIRHLLAPETIRKHGYFDTGKVLKIVAALEQIKDALASDPGLSLRFDRSVVNRTVLGMALTFVVTTQILADQVETGRFGAS
jgi:asparagine synthase (glutamine-hydrolysing)